LGLALALLTPGNCRPRSVVFRAVPPDAAGHHTVHIECLPNAGCTLFTEFLCGQLLSRGVDVACFPDIFDCTTALPRRPDERLPRGHHYVAKTKLWPIFGDRHGRERPPPALLDPATHVLREWSSLGRTVNILFMRDPLQNMLSLRSKLFCAACGGMRARLALADRLFAQLYPREDAERSDPAALAARSPYWDALLFAEDMADPEALLRTLTALLGAPALGARPCGIAEFKKRGLHRYKSKPLARENARLGYAWAGVVPVNGTRTGRYAKDGEALRFGTGNAKLVSSPTQPFYSPRARPHDARDRLLAHALAPRLAAAYAGEWPAAAAGEPATVGTLGTALSGALGGHTCHGCRKGGCPRNASAGVGPPPQMFGVALPHRPRDLRVFYATLEGPPLVPVSGQPSAATAELRESVDEARADGLLYALAHALPGERASGSGRGRGPRLRRR
jgi:hypothetical protein